ncbi:MAG: hypothetical protein JW827_01150 [Spirochaetes bacterium]|nr:hypothetical protein [Spirochaetota bacterium]
MNKKIILLIFLCVSLFFIFFPQVAYLNITHFTDITLEDMIERSGYILVVTKQSPFETRKKIKIHPDTKKYPPFEHAVFHFQVKEELYSKDKTSLRDKKIDVLPPDLADRLDLYKRYHLEGVSKSPIYLNYQTKVDFYKSKEMIIFLSKKENEHYLMTVNGGYEKLSKKKKIYKLIKKLK